MNGLKTVAQLETVSGSLSHDLLSSILTLSLILVNWRLYAQVVQVCVTLFNTMFLLVQSLLEVRGEQDPLPAFDYPQLEDSEYVPFFFSVFQVSQPFLFTRTKGRRLIVSTNGSHIGSPGTMREWSQWIYNHIETLDKVRGCNNLCVIASCAQIIKIPFFFIRNRFSFTNLHRTSFRNNSNTIPATTFNKYSTCYSYDKYSVLHRLF